MRRIVAWSFLVTIILAVIPIGAESATVPAGHSIGGALPDYLNSIAVDSSGNVYLAGGVQISPSTNEYGAYIAKFSKNGSLVWDRQTNVTSDSYFLDVVVSGTGDIYAMGWCRDGNFLAKMTANGDLVWAKQVTNFWNSYLVSIDIDHSSGGIVAACGGSNSGPIVSIYPNGTVRWSVWTPTYLDEPCGIVNDATGISYVLIHHWDTSDIGIVKLNTDGDIVAQKILDTPAVEEWAGAIAIASDGGIVCSGVAAYDNLMIVSKLDGNLKGTWVEYISHSEYYFEGYGLATPSSGKIFVLASGSSMISGLMKTSLFELAANGAVNEASMWRDQEFGDWFGPEDITASPNGQVVFGGSVIGIPQQQLEPLTDLVIDKIPAANWNNANDVWSATTEHSTDFTLSMTDPDMLVDVFDEGLSNQMFYGYLGTPSTIEVQIDHSIAVPDSTVVDLMAIVSGGTAPHTYRWSFGDGSFSDGASPTHDYNEPGIYYAQVYVEDSLGASVADSSIILVYGPPEVDSLTYSPIPGWMPVMEGIPISFLLAAHDPDGGELQYLWDLGDGTYNSTNQSSIEHTYDIKGQYTVNVTVTDDETRTTMASVNITIAENIPPTASIHVWPSHPRPGQDIQFGQYSDDPDDFVESYLWDFADGNTSIESMPWHAYSLEGVYNVSLTVTDTGGKQGVAWHEVTVMNNWPPEPDFFVWPMTPSTNQSTRFDAHQSSDWDGSIIDWIWDFGDGTNGSGEYEWHTFTDGGFRNVTLTVVDNDGGYANLTRMIYVNHEPVVDFNWFPVSPLPNETILFDATLTYDVDNNISMYTWRFLTSTLSSYDPYCNIRFSIGGDYCINLTVTDDAGGVGVATKWIHVDTKPIANAGPDQEVLPGAIVGLNGSQSFDDLGIVNYTWYIPGLGVTLEGMVCSYNFREAGEFSVRLVVTDTRGQTSTPDWVTIRVIDVDPPVADAGLDINVTTGLPVQFDGSESHDDGVIVNYTWTFEYDGTNITLYGISPTFTFLIEGDYLITLNVTDASNKSSNDTMMVSVSGMIPEFPTPFIPIAGIVVILLAAHVRRRRT